jgi:hypothetical protein
MATSLPNHHRPIFKPREMSGPDMRHWYVEAEWSDGTIDGLDQFKSISEAWNWITRQSRARLEKPGQLSR